MLIYLFGIDDGDSHEDENDDNDDDSNGERKDYDTSSKSFHLLNALSDFMMLPKDMLLSRSIRKEVQLLNFKPFHFLLFFNAGSIYHVFVPLLNVSSFEGMPYIRYTIDQEAT